MQRVDAVAERAQDVPETGRVRPAGDERDHLAAHGNQLVAADVLLDAGQDVHRNSLAGEAQKISERYVPLRCIPIAS